jgi:hypothetical protein
MQPTSRLFVCLIPFILGCGTSTPPAKSPEQSPTATTVAKEGPDAPQAESAASMALLDGGETFDGKVFKLRLPKGWIVKPDAVAALHARATETELFPNIKVAILRLPDGKTITDAVNASKESYLKSGTVEEVSEITLRGQPVHRMVMTQNLPDNLNRQLKYFVPAGPRVVIFSGQAKSAEFETHLPLFEAVIRTLEVAP